MTHQRNIDKKVAYIQWTDVVTSGAWGIFINLFFVSRDKERTSGEPVASYGGHGHLAAMAVS